MDKASVIKSLTEKYSTFVDYINGLTKEEYLYRYEQKWTAEQQLEHMVLCVKPLVQVFSMEKPVIEQHFGKTDRPGRSYEALLSDYLAKLGEGGKAPDRFVPEANAISPKEILCESLTQMIHVLCAKTAAFTDQELDTLLIPHPLLGNLTLREMLYNAIYHVGHHQEQAQRNLENR